MFLGPFFSRTRLCKSSVLSSTCCCSALVSQDYMLYLSSAPLSVSKAASSCLILKGRSQSYEGMKQSRILKDRSQYWTPELSKFPPAVCSVLISHQGSFTWFFITVIWGNSSQRTEHIHKLLLSVPFLVPGEIQD